MGQRLILYSKVNLLKLTLANASFKKAYSYIN